MGFITELNVVNLCLASMGELPINSLENSRNPIVTNAREVFKNATIEEQAPGWWFNIETPRLLPQADGTYLVPGDTLSLNTKDNFNPEWLTVRKGLLYDVGKAQYYTGTQSMEVRMIRLLPFDDLPYSAQRMVRDAAVRLFQINYDGDELKIEQAEKQYIQGYGLCMSDHIRAVGANMLTGGNYGASLTRSRIPYGRSGRWS